MLVQLLKGGGRKITRPTTRRSFPVSIHVRTYQIHNNFVRGKNWLPLSPVIKCLLKRSFLFFFFFRDNVIKAASIFRRFHVHPWKRKSGWLHARCIVRHGRVHKKMFSSVKCSASKYAKHTGRGRDTCPVNATRSIAHATPLNRVSTRQRMKNKQGF